MLRGDPHRWRSFGRVRSAASLPPPYQTMLPSFGGVLRQADGVTGHLAGVNGAEPLAHSDACPLQAGEELLFRARPGRGDGHLTAQAGSCRPAARAGPASQPWPSHLGVASPPAGPGHGQPAQRNGLTRTTHRLCGRWPNGVSGITTTSVLIPRLYLKGHCPLCKRGRTFLSRLVTPQIEACRTATNHRVIAWTSVAGHQRYVLPSEGWRRAEVTVLCMSFTSPALKKNGKAVNFRRLDRCIDQHVATIGRCS